MAYTPPDGDAVDFTLTGVVVLPPDGDKVDFVFPPAVLARSSLSVEPVHAADAIQLYAYGNVSISPSVEAYANHQYATGALVVKLSADAVVSTARFAAGALQVKLVVDGVAAAGKSADAALSVVPSISSVAAFVHDASSALPVVPSVAAVAYRPAYEAAGDLRVVLSVSASATPGVIASGALVVQPIVMAKTASDYTWSADFHILPSISAAASAGASSSARCSGWLLVKPTIQAVASA